MRNSTDWKSVYLFRLVLALLCCGLILTAVNSSAKSQPHKKSDPVIVVNPENKPVPVTVKNVSTREPINIKTIISGSTGNSIMVVPEDTYLVIETVSARVLSQVALDELKVWINVDGGYQKPNLRYFIPMSSELSAGGSDSTGYIGTQNMRVYAEPGVEVVAEMSSRPQTGDALTEVSLSGYLLPLESPTLSP